MDKGKGSAGSTEETLHELMQVSTRVFHSTPDGVPFRRPGFSTSITMVSIALMRATWQVANILSD